MLRNSTLVANEITKDADISDALKTYFTSTGSKLASTINSSNIDAASCIHPTDKVFAIKLIWIYSYTFCSVRY